VRGFIEEMSKNERRGQSALTIPTITHAIIRTSRVSGAEPE
jgi:hypothetical protein